MRFLVTPVVPIVGGCALLERQHEMGSTCVDSMDRFCCCRSSHLSIRRSRPTVGSPDNRLVTVRSGCLEPDAGGNGSIWIDAGSSNGPDLDVADGYGFASDAKT